MADYRVISADTHVIETPDLWRSRIDPKYRDRCPRIVNIEGKDVWIVDNLIAGGAVIGQGARVGMRFDQRDELVKPVDSFDQVRLGAYDPHEALKDMDIDGIDVAVIYPTEGFALYHECRDSELLTASLSAYNGWLADFCSAHPKRLKGVGFINVDDVQTGIKEMERFAKLGLVGAHIPVYNSRLRYNSPVFEPLWAAAEDLDMSIALHINSNRPADHEEFGLAGVAVAPLFFINGDYWPRMSIADMIFSGVFDRYPKLRLVVVEYEAAWAAPFLKRMDFQYEMSRTGIMGHRLKDDKVPSDHFHSNVYLGIMQDGLAIQLREIIGVDNLLWGNDYPHVESTFPRSQQFLEEIFADCTEEEKVKIAGANAERVYRL